MSTHQWNITYCYQSQIFKGDLKNILSFKELCLSIQIVITIYNRLPFFHLKAEENRKFVFEKQESTSQMLNKTSKQGRGEFLITLGLYHNMHTLPVEYGLDHNLYEIKGISIYLLSVVGCRCANVQRQRLKNGTFYFFRWSRKWSLQEM